MTRRALAITAIVCAALALVSIFALDRPIAQAVQASVLASAAVFVEGTRMLDAVAGRSLLHSHLLSGILLGGVLFGLGFLGCLLNRRGYLSRALMFTGGVQLATIGCIWLLKHEFGRLRPYQVFGHGDWSHVWFAGGDSFPSGHNAFFWGLFLPLMYLFPRYRLVLLIVPVFIACARIDMSFHFLSDVLSAIALAALVTLIAATVCARWIRPAAR
ncbi:MAG: phosphatase PAP2 family protein [Rudaea sp.]